MDRREFLKGGAGAGVLGSVASGNLCSTNDAPTSETITATTPAVLKAYTVEDHRRRLQNIALCEQGVRRCMRKHLITNYIPGQCCYNLCEYPSRKRWEPNDYDEQELDRLRGQGIGLIQIMEGWNDPLRLFGGDHFTPQNPAGFRRFLDMAHRRGIKVLPYISTGYFISGLASR